MMNDEWLMMNDEWWMMSDEWWVMNDEWGMMNGEWWMGNDEWGKAVFVKDYLCRFFLFFLKKWISSSLFVNSNQKMISDEG